MRTAISFWHGMNRLVGDLVVPPWPGPHPGVVIVEGAGPGGRQQGTWPERLAAAGIASFAYDKPGCGESTGDWRMQSLDDRAEETLAAVQALGQLPELREDAVALLGGSQGGWVAPLAAAQSRGRVAAVVLVSGPAVGVLELENFRLGRQLGENGFNVAEVALAQALLRERVRRLASGDTPDAVLNSEAACRSAPWYGLMPGITPEEIAFLARIADYDPGPVLGSLRCPVLALYGADDILVPVEESMRRMRDVMRRSGNPDHHIVVVPHADHGLRIYTGPGEPRMEYGLYSPGELAPGVLELIVTWLDRRIGRAPAMPTYATGR